MEILTTPLEGLLLIKPKLFGDERGYFFEPYHEDRYRKAGLSCRFVQDNTSRSQKGVLRGLHYQKPQPQTKLIQILRGEVFDVAVDVRQGSPTFGQSFSYILNDRNHHQLFIPAGFAHGFYVLSEVADFYYKCSDYYAPQFESGILWSDPELHIDWPIPAGEPPIISAKDQAHPLLKHLPQAKLPSFLAEEG